MKLNKFNRRTSPYSALRDYIAQLDIIGRLMRIRISGIVLTASSARAVASLHLLSKLLSFQEYSTLHPWLLHKTRTRLQVARQRMTLPAPVSRPSRNDCPHLHAICPILGVLSASLLHLLQLCIDCCCNLSIALCLLLLNLTVCRLHLKQEYSYLPLLHLGYAYCMHTVP